MIQKENNQAQEFVRISELCFVYAKAKWMRTFKAFDLDGFFPGRLIYASMIRDNDENREKLQQLAERCNFLSMVVAPPVLLFILHLIAIIFSCLSSTFIWRSKFS